MNELNTLKLTRPYMHGPAVTRLQELGDMLGYDLGPNDGIFGPNTEAVVLAVQRHAGLKPDGICGPKTWRVLLGQVDENSKDNPFIKVEHLTVGDGIIDRRGVHNRPKLYKCPRDWSDIQGVTLHQTGCEMPKNPRGWDRLNAHIGITQEGAAILVNDPRDWIWHAQGLSKNTIGIEIEGNYRGLDKNERTLWKGGGGPHHLNDKMLTALFAVEKWLAEQFRLHGKKWTKVHAHRQSARSRIADPGEEIWKAVALPWLARIESTSAAHPDGGDDFCLGMGRPIPAQWDENRKADYFCPCGG